MLSRQLLFAPNGTPLEPELIELRDALDRTYDTRDVAAQLLCIDLVIQVWRTGVALAVEVKAQRKYGVEEYLTSSYLAQVQRYSTAARNAVVKTLSLLEQYRRPPAAEPEVVDPEEFTTPEPSTEAATLNGLDKERGVDALPSDSCNPATTRQKKHRPPSACSNVIRDELDRGRGCQQTTTAIG